MSKSVSIRLPDNLAKGLELVADETERPRSFHVQKALEAYLEDFADLRVALDRLKDPKDHLVSGKDMRKSLGL
jgi:RHH-type rel operon transcriptional repressor/antitoxin RelB